MRVRRLFVLPAVAAGVLLPATAADAHVEVEAAPARALAPGATLTMVAESESASAGVTGVRIQLPAGLLPADFTLGAAPKGWQLTGSGPVLQVRGPALPAGQDLRFTMRVRQLPQAERLVLKTVQSYSDGKQDSWIEVPTPGGREPDSVAPVLELAAAAPGATPIPRATPARPSATPTPSATPSSTPTASATPTTGGTGAPDAESADDSPSAGRWLGGAVVLGLLTGGVVTLIRKRRSPAS